MKYDLFISHSHHDRDWSRRIADSLRRYGVEVWLDDEQLPPGERWQSAIKKGLEQSTCVLTVVDPKNATQPNTFFEAGMAVGLGKKVLFVIPEKQQDLPADLKVTSFVYRRAPDITAREIIKSLPASDPRFGEPTANALSTGRDVGDPNVTLRTVRRHYKTSARKK